MRFLRRDRMSDEEIERVLSGRRAPAAQASALDAFGSAVRGSGDQAPSEPTAAAHLSAITAESRRVRQGAVEHPARPATPRRLHALPKRIAASAGALAAFIALAIAGALPGPVQAAASDALAVVGISLPDGGDERSDAARDRQQRPAASTPTSSRTVRPAVEQDRAQPRQAPGGGTADGQAERDRDRAGSGQAGDDPERNDERGGAADGDRRDADEEPRGAEAQRAPGEEHDGGGAGTDSHADEDQPENSNEIPGGGVANDEEGPDAGTRPAEEPDEPDEPKVPDTGTEGRTGASGDPLPDSGDEFDVPEE